MTEYLDKTGLAYFWGKIKEKLNAKSDNDKYKVATFTRKKQTMESGKISNIQLGVMLDLPEANNFVEAFPDGYHISCVLAADWHYYASEEKYNDDSDWDVGSTYHIEPIQTVESMGNVQRVSVDFNEEIEPYGQISTYTLLLEKD